MRIGKVIGTVTLNRRHPSLVGANLKLVAPLATKDLIGDNSDSIDDALVAWDQLGAGYGNLIAIAEGPEAAQPFRPRVIPIDAYAAAILDELNVDEVQVRKMVDQPEE